MLFLGAKFIVSLDAPCNSPSPLMGVLWVALAQTQPAGAVVGKARTGARSEGVHQPSHAQHIPNNRCMNQNHLLSISLTFSLDAQPAARFFTPGTRTILPSTHEPPKALGSAGRTLWLLLCLFVCFFQKTKSYTSLKHVSKHIIYH